MLYDKFSGKIGKFISYLLILTTHSMTSYVAYASDDFNQAVSNANSFASQLLDQRSTPEYDIDGNLLINGEIYMSRKEIIGQRDGDYVPADQNTFGSDNDTLMQAQIAQDKYDEKTQDTAKTSGEKAYHIIKQSMASQKPDLTNDPMWNNTDNIYENLGEISKDFANCTVSTELVTTGDNYHVPVYKKCERLPYREEKITLVHEYEVGVIKHNSGAMNLAPCGDGCMRMWIGTVGNDYWSGWCTIYEESMSVEVLQPSKITQAKITYAKFDDWFQIYLNKNKVYNGPYPDQFPPETHGECELSTSWEVNPNVNVTENFRNVGAGSVLFFKTRTSVAGNGEGFARLELHYDPKDIVFNETWSDNKTLERAYEIIGNKGINADGMCEVSSKCLSMPSIDGNGCTEINGILTCESNFKVNKFAPFGISPFCAKVEVSLSCGFNDGQFCSTNMDGVETCVDSTEQIIDYNQCKKYEEDPKCSYIGTKCVEGAEGNAGGCYVQEYTYDCGFNASNETSTEDQVIRCDGQLQCVGENCYSPERDAGNTDFAQTAAFLEMLRYAKSDMSCEGVPDAPFNPELPPDQYVPVPTCPDGYSYDSATKKCLKPLRCTYSDGDFFAASPRNGIQVLEGNKLIANDPSIPICTTVVKNSAAYTCGEIQKKLATDSFYEVCSNTVTQSNSSGCPSTSHAINPATNFCEVPPTPSCLEGYDLFEGVKPFDKTDYECIAPRKPYDPTCPEGYNVLGGRCEKVTNTSHFYTCPSGYTLNGTTCSKSISTGSSWSCHNGGSLSGSTCTQQYSTSPSTYCSSPSAYNCSQAIGYPTCRWTCRSNSGGGSYSVTTAGQRNCPINTSWTGSVCNGMKTYTASRTCPSGYDLSGTTCYKTENISASLNCPSDYIWIGSVCEKREYLPYTPVCETNYILSPDNTECIRNPEKVKPDFGCPSSYPVWDEKDGRCRSASLNPLANIQRLLDSNELNSQQSFDLMKSYKVVQNELVPALASEAALTTENKPKSITQESMKAYIGDKFNEMAVKFDKQKSMNVTGQNQLSQFAMASGVKNTLAPKAGGDTNVTCELFKGTAGECKIAVGGFQDCCESPVATSLNDYITLTRTVIEMDGMTSAIVGLENYSGVWETASNWSVEMANTAWETVGNAFTSGADVIGPFGANGIVEGSMAAVAQSIMGYTQTFLTQTFGADVAAMFFTSATSSTTGVTTVGLSPQMAAVGNALMYVYYAYLAYVVFNLLVNIVYECEEEEFDLAMKVEILSAHAIGTYCKSDALGVCIEKRRAYCVFDSPLSRIVMEQIYKQPQMGLSWGTPQQPLCQGVDIEDMEKVNWDDVNLDEWIGILISTDNYIANETIDFDRITGAGSILNTGDDDEQRENAIERSESRMEDMNLDEIRRSAYEDGWNELKQ